MALKDLKFPALGAAKGKAAIPNGDLHLDDGAVIYAGSTQIAPSDGGASRGIQLLSSTVVDFNDDTETKQNLYTCPASQRAIQTQIVVQKSSNGASGGEFSIGWNFNADDVIPDFMTTQAVPGGPAAILLPLYSADYPMIIGTAGQHLGLKCLYGGGDACTARVDVFGYLTNASGVPV